MVWLDIFFYINASSHEVWLSPIKKGPLLNLYNMLFSYEMVNAWCESTAHNLYKLQLGWKLELQSWSDQLTQKMEKLCIKK